MKKSGEENRPKSIKISSRVPRELWRQVQHRAIDEERDVQELLSDALLLYLKTPLRKGIR